MAEHAGRPAGQVHRSATRGASAGSASTGTASGCIGHDGNTIGQAAFLRILPEAGPRGRAAHQRRQHPRPLRGPLPRDLRRARRTSTMPQPLAPPAEPVEVDITPYVGTLRAGVGAHGGLRAATDGPRAAHDGHSARSPSWCPTRSRSTRWSRSAENALRGPPPARADLGAGDVLLAADRRGVRALRRAGHPAGSS